MAKQEPEASTMKLENTEKRDTLREIEKKYQKEWQDNHVFEAEPPADIENPHKFFGTMAYPYVNGVPHLGHAFTVSKIEFAARVGRAQGKRVLYPQGYHCTGMPIKACADKLVNEVALFGQNFEKYSEEEQKAPEPEAEKPAAAKTDATKFSNTKKGKAALKSAAVKYQFQVMLSIGVPREEIHKFQDPQYWLHYFPQIWQTDLTSFGCSIDWRRSFVTTDANPYYDSFTKWQMRILRAQNKIQYGSRYTVYSPKDQQPCLDHDRQSGEGVNVQEYTAIKCKVETWSEAASKALEKVLPAGANVYLVPATLRSETMYGQTNVFVSPKITYGVFKSSETEYYVITNRAARNMAFQNIFKWGEIPKVGDIVGSDLIGTLINAPLSHLKQVYVVPMDTIKDSKGTGVVTSVPSDSPDDYAMTVELGKKPDYYGIKLEWVPSADSILPIIETPEYGNLIAQKLVKDLKINSPKDAKLAEAKDIAYKQGFYQGKMIYGDFKGEPVQDAKPKVRQALIDSGEAFAYSEPDGQVISRSGDECVAALLPQWFLAYGDATPEWRQQVLDYIRSSDFNSFTTETLHSIEATLNWMNNWAVTRAFGLGSRLPWDETQLVESLSDSTIYMAYYTVARYLHKDIYGKEQGIGKITPAQMTDSVWDYIFSRSDKVESDIPKDTLDAMKKEFQYWYGLDVRVSGKDLINNHLIFMLYIHQAIWGDQGHKYLPHGIRMNGHAMLNGEKMSKSTGNFLTLKDAVEKFGADAVRVALADAGDGIEDANIEEPVANAVILKLYELKQWIEDVVLHARLLKDGESIEDVKAKEKVGNISSIQRTGPLNFWDDLFANEMNALVKDAIANYDKFLFKAALKSSLYDFTAARDTYRVNALAAGVGMHKDLVTRYVELQARLIAPLAPHWAEYIWRDVLKKNTYISVEAFPTVEEPKESLTAAAEYIRTTTSALGSSEANSLKKLSKGKASTYDPKSDKRVTIFVAKSWPSWQSRCIEIVREMFDGVTLDLKSVSKKVDKADSKKAMPFIQMVKRKLEGGDKSVFDRKMAFDEIQVLGEMVPGFKSTVVKLKEVVIVVVEDGKGTTLTGESVVELPPAALSAEPGSPSFEFVNV